MKLSQLLNRKDSIKEKTQIAYVRASKLFDERWYVSHYQDVFKKLKDPARHYYLRGWKENRNPSENFDTAAYLRQYPECGICPIVFEHNRNDYADLAVCIIVKDEAPYIKEWLDYHLMVGVKRFYIYDNESFDNLKQVLLPYIRQGVVIYQYYPGEVMQLNCYRDFLKQYGDKNEWVAFIDADEFIIPMENATIPEFLADYKEYPAVGVNWVSYDSNGHKEKPKGGVLENYTRVHYDENLVPFHLIKSIVRPQEVSKVVNPHFFLYKGDKLAVNENKEEIGGDLSERAYISPFSTNKIRINHYYCKSRAEAEAKVLRGSSDRNKGRLKNISAKELNFPDYKYDYTAYKFVLQLNPEKAKIEEIKMAWLRLKNAFIEFKHTFNPSPLYDYIDEEWYFKQYPDAQKSGMSAAKHYVNIGWRKGYNPSKKFNTEFYLNKYKDVAKAHICPLLHYLNSGKNEGRLAYETDTVISATEPVSQPLLKHLSEWGKSLFKEKEREYNELWQNKAYFDENWYLKQYPDAKESGMSAKKHYDTIGWLQGYNPSAKFKTNEYLKQYPECGICPIDFEYNRNRYVDLAVCAIMKNEAPYVKEWLDYHQMVGVKRFYIYDNESSDDLCQVLLPYIRQGIVVYKNYPGEAKQMPAYNEFIKEYGDKNEWVAFIDADEFIIPMEKESIPEFLADYKEYPGIGINWVAYDSNGHKAKPEGGVLENYTRVHYDENLVPFHQIKSIVQPSQVDKIINPHYALFKDDKLAVNENKQEIGGSLEERAYISPFSVSKIRINHYFTKSEEEYKAKIERGRAPTKRSVKRVYNQNQVFFDDYKYDYSAYRFVTKLKSEIAQDEEVKYVWQKMKNAWIAFKHSFNQNPLYDYIDENWYFEQYPDAKESGMSAAEHYMNIGWRKGYNPSEKFDTNFYLKKYKDVARMHVCPLLHYLNSGKKEGRLAFEGDTAIHTEQSDTVISTTKPASQQIKGNTGFSPVSQPTQNNTVIPAQSNTVIPATEPVSLPLVKSLCQWIKTVFKGKEEKYNELWNNNEYFDEDWYVANYVETQSYKNGPKAHYRAEGWKKGYNPSPKFNTEEYLKQYPECKICPIDFEYNRNGYVDLSIVAIMKNEAPYVKEWIDYHRLVGVKRFYIYDNESEDNLKEVLTPYIEKGVVVYKYYPGLKKDGVQTKAYNECIANYKDKNEWLAIIDADEFVVPVEKDTIPEFLKDYEGYPGVVINWMCFDSNKHINKPKGGVLENYTRCHFYHYCHEDTRVKCIVNPRKVSLADIHFHHYVNESNGEYAVDSNKSPVKFNQDKDAPLYDKIRINHYWCKSQQEYLNKVKKPRVSGKEFKVHKQNYDFNDGIYDYKVYRQVANLNGHFLKEKVKYIWSHILNFILYPERSILYAYIDERYYQIHYPEYKNEAKDAVTHYMTIGWKKGYNPSEKFDTKFYLEKYPDIAASKMNPLLHYVMHGLYSRLPKAGAVLPERKEKKFFRIYSYVEKLCHFVKQQDSSRITKYMPYFDEKWYIAQYPEAKKYRGGAKAHYCKEGWRKEYNPSEKFSTEEYLKQYPECKICPLDFEYNRNGYVDLSIVAIMRNEGPYVKEWIDYHRLVGVKRFYIYDNESTDNLNEVLAPYIEQGIVVYKYFPGRKEDGMQTKAYTECINDYKDKTEWLAIIDADEFIVPMKKKNIPNFLKDYKEYPGVVVNWVVYDSNGHTDKPEGGVLENYARIHFSHNCNDDRMIKSIVNPRKVMYPEGHCSIYNNNECAVTENFTRHPHMNSTIFHSGNKIRINHYWTKSKSEYLAKIKKPRCNGIYLQETENHYNFKDFKYDYAVWKYVAKLDKKFLKEFFKYIQYSVKSFLIGMKHPPVPDINDYVDEKYYSQHYPEYKNEAKSALVHYMSIGWKRGYNPSDKFDTNYYLNRYHDIAKVGMNPLLHYVSSGYKEGRMPKLKKPSIWSNLFSSSNLSQNELYSKIYASKLFDKRWYLRHYSEVSKQHIDPLEHYLTTGWKKGYNPSNKFDTNFYLNTYPDIKQADINPLIHYLNYGKAEGRNIADVVESRDTVLATLYKKLFVKKLNNPKISVIVASYNYEQYIRETLDSLINQTYKNFEVVVVDDGSKDNSVSVVKEYVNKYDNVFLFTHENGKNNGLVETVKLGISKSTGEYIAFCESDDYWAPTHLEEKVKLINKYFNPEIVVNDVELFGKKDLDYEKYLDNNLRTLTGEKINVNVTMQKYNVVPTFSCTMIRKDILTKCDFDSVVVAWTDWWIYRQILSVAPLYYIPQKLTFWRLHDSYNSSEKSAEYMRKYNEFIVYSNAIITKHNKNFNSILENNENCQLIKSSDLFDEKWYLEQHKDVRDMHISASYHYNMLGWKKGYNPSSKFDTEAYLNLYPDVKELDVSPLVHYIKHGKKEGRSCISCIHKPEFYNTKNISDRRYKRNILLVSHMLNHTGAPVLLKQVAELLNKKRYKVTVLSPKDGDLRDEILQVGADVIVDPNAFAKEQDCEYLKKYNFAFCICNTYINALIYSYLSKFIPSILWIHDNLNEKTANLIMPVLSTSKDIYAASKLTKSYMVPYNKNIKILTYPANDVVGNIRKCNADGHKPRIAVCAALQPRKGQDIFIEAVKELPENIRKNAEFLLLGEEGQVGYKEILEGMCQDISEIKFVDAIKTPAEYHKFIDGLDVLCCPSREDPCPLVVLDAFMHGVPVIVSDHVGQKDIIRNKKDGYIFKNEDIDELSQILNHLIVSKEYLLMRTKSRAIFDRNFSDKTFLNDLFKIMEEKCAI